MFSVLYIGVFSSLPAAKHNVVIVAGDIFIERMWLSKNNAIKSQTAQYEQDDTVFGKLNNVRSCHS